MIRRVGIVMECLLISGLVALMLFCCEGDKLILTRAPLEYVSAELTKLAPVKLEVDLSALQPGDRAALGKIIQAARSIDELFLLQVNPDNLAMLRELERSRKPAGEPYLQMFRTMFGPWNRLDNEKPFINDKPKPVGAGFYPEDMTKAEFEQFIADHPDQRPAFVSEFTIVRRQNGVLKAVPYHEAYANQVNQISRLLKEAAALTQDETLRRYLTLRAEDFLTDDYFRSDMAWMDLAGDLEIVIGPYEVYEDNIFSYKAAYEAFICVVDHAESRKLDAAAQYLNEMEANLPIPDQYKNFNRGLSSPIKVVQEVFSAGDTKSGIQTTAFNLPNDERVREAKGSKKVMLKNIAQAKYEQCWIPIVNQILAPQPLRNVSFECYFNHVLLHEISHGLGPGLVTLPDGRSTSVSRELKEFYPVVEECKADVMGIYNLLFLMKKGVIPEEQKYSIFASYLGGMFRSIRFGIHQAHGGGVAIQFNYFMEKEAFLRNEDGLLDLNPQKLEKAVATLLHELLMIQARCDYAAAAKLVAQYRQETPVIREMVSRLTDIPIDIRPEFAIGQ